MTIKIPKEFCRSWQSASKMYMEMKRAKNIKDIWLQRKENLIGYLLHLSWRYNHESCIGSKGDKLANTVEKDVHI
jgi:hypothetical protein